MSLFDDDDWRAAGTSRAGTSRAGTSRAGSLGPGTSAGGAGQRSFLNRLTSVAGSDDGDYSLGLGRETAEAIPEERIGDGEAVFDAVALDPGPEEEELDDVRRLSRVWVRERGTPAILQWEGDLLDSLLDKLEQQGKMIATLRSDPATSEEEHFRLVLVQTEMERAKFLVRSYVRTRLHKIEKHAQHILATQDLHGLLSGGELAHAQRYADLIATHFTHSVLDSLPEWLQKMDDSTGDGLQMVIKPNHNLPVLVYCRKDCGEITLERGEVAVLAQGTTHLVCYHMVERWIALGWAEVL